MLIDLSRQRLIKEDKSSLGCMPLTQLGNRPGSTGAVH
jgi:hypothetical protein